MQRNRNRCGMSLNHRRFPFLLQFAYKTLKSRSSFTRSLYFATTPRGRRSEVFLCLVLIGTCPPWLALKTLLKEMFTQTALYFHRLIDCYWDRDCEDSDSILIYQNISFYSDISVFLGRKYLAGVLIGLAAFRDLPNWYPASQALAAGVLIGLAASGTALAQEKSIGCLCNLIFLLGGRLIFGPDLRSLFFSVSLISAPVAVFCVFVARKLTNEFPPHLGISIMAVAVVITLCVTLTLYSSVTSFVTKVMYLTLLMVTLRWFHNLMSLNESLKLLDVCGVAKDVLLQAKEDTQQLQSIMRRRKAMKLLENDGEATFSMFAVFESLFSFIFRSKMESKSTNCSLACKWMSSKRLTCEGKATEINEFKKVNAFLCTVIGNKTRKSGKMSSDDAQIGVKHSRS
ncbi:Detected protein of unknown function [Hibiscus syriacus]|uniref:Uncharacterized protein n=1 Tax=Hibiscus syriacus TaxID=106335 RepID=A0A6A3CKB7_HIBSY|nr:Detected protein of unknown function [Hibiscus syriacus]